MSTYEFDPYVHSIARRQPRRLPACLSGNPVFLIFVCYLMAVVSNTVIAGLFHISKVVPIMNRINNIGSWMPSKL